jgi:Flp pilus assembly protein CpaB
MTYSVRNILIAMVTAVAAAVVVLLYTSSFKEQVTKDQQRVGVLVAKADIPAGSSAEKAAGSMELRDVLASDRAPGAITAAAQIDGRVATQTVFAGQQVVADVFQQAITQSASLQLDKTQRGVRIEVDTSKGVLGTVKAGETVDVFGTFEVETDDGDTGVVSRLLLKDVRILEAPGPTDDDKADITEKQIVMLSVTQREATKLAFMAADDSNRTIQLVVRPPKGQAAEMPVSVETLETMIMEGLTVAEIKQRLPQLTGAVGGRADARAPRAAEAPRVAEGPAVAETATAPSEG